MSMYLYDRPVFSKLIFFEKGISAMSNLQVNMTKDPIVKSLVIFALPILFSNIFQQLYNTIDIMIVGNFLGDSSLAAIGASSSIYELLLGFCFGVGNGLSIVVSRYFGQGDKTLLKKSVAGSIIIALILTAILMTASSLGLYPLMRALKTPENLLAESHSYVSTLTTFIGVMFAYNLLAGLLRGIGNSFMPLVFLIISSLTNILLDLLFITRFQMGIRGAAVATVIAQGFSVILCLIYIIRKTPILVPGTAAFCGWQKALSRAYHPGTFHGLYERSGFLRNRYLTECDQRSWRSVYRLPCNGKKVKFLLSDAGQHHRSFHVHLCFPEPWCRKQRPDPQGYTHCLYHGRLLGCYSDNHSLFLRSKSGYTVRLHTGCDSG